MTPSPCSRTSAGLLVLLAVLASPSAAFAQATCPSASTVDATGGWAAYQDGDMAVARTLFQRALGVCDNDQYARTGLGYVELRDGFIDQAEAAFARVVDAEPNNIDALVGLGLAAWRVGALDTVREYFRRVQVLEPDNATAADFLDRVDGAATPPAAPTDPADAAWAGGDMDRAFELYSARLDRDATDGMALLRVGQMRSWREQYAAALELLDLLVDLEPNNVDALLARARVHAWSGDIVRAEQEVLYVLSVVPDNPDALAALALFQSWTGRMDEAFATYDDLLSIAPEHTSGRRQQARARSWTRQTEASVQSYEALVAENPDDIEARLGLAATLGYAGQYDRSLQEYDQLLARAGRDMRALTGRARTLTWSGRLIDAERAALAAIEVDNASGAAWSTLGEVYRAQNRDAAARDAFETATGFDPGNPDIRDQYRAVELALSPDLRPTVTAEDDSDGNRMVTTALGGAWNLTSRLELDVRGYYKQLEQDAGTFFLEHRAYGGMATAEYQAWPGWRLRGGIGASATDGPGDPSFLAVTAGIRTPDRSRLGLSLDVSSQGLDETAALARRGVRASTGVVALRWFPDATWRLDGSFGLGEYEGAESNARREWFAGVSRRLGRGFSLGLAHRGFSFEKNLDEGYFDPDFYGILELTSYWLYRPSAWSLLVEVAPGVQQVTTDGDPEPSIRGNLRLGYLVGDGREISLSSGYSSAGLTSFASGETDYRYFALILGVTWIL